MIQMDKDTRLIAHYAIRETVGLAGMGVALFWSAGRFVSVRRFDLSSQCRSDHIPPFRLLSNIRPEPRMSTPAPKSDAFEPLAKFADGIISISLSACRRKSTEPESGWSRLQAVYYQESSLTPFRNAQPGNGSTGRS